MSALDDHFRLVQGLRAALAGALPPEAVPVVQTHISTLLLTPDTVYKLRQPLRLPFLDFSSPEQRRRDCEDELRLNRRTAPQLYRRVLPVTGTWARPQLGGAGEPIDWALEMRRFPEGALLADHARAGTLDAPKIDALAQAIAGFHEGLPPSPPAFGSSEHVWHWMEDSLASLRNDAALPSPCRHLVATLGEALRAAFEEGRMQIDTRRAAGRVREGHGDLHLGNIVWLDGAPVLFDALEFNDALRHIDVVNDLAFAVMDLHAHGLAPMAWRLASAWADLTGDHAGLVLLPLFTSYRALVRAKVAWMQKLPDACARYLALAQALLQPASPRLVLTMGLSGSGKTTVSQHLLERLGAVRLRSDVERKRLHGLGATDRGGVRQGLYTPEATARTFHHLREQSRILLQGGLSVVVDAAFLRRAEREAFAALADERRVAFHVVECTAPDAVLCERIGRREQANTDASDATTTVLDLQLRVREPLGPHEAPYAVQLDTDATPEAVRSRCEALVQVW
jgi:uncharacterized protein